VRLAIENDAPIRGELNGQSTVSASDHLRYLPLGHADAKITTLRLRGQELDPEPRAQFRPMLARTTPGNEAPHQLLVAQLGKAELDEYLLAERDRFARRIEDAAARQGRLVMAEELFAVAVARA
jgi:hypothetical protein